MHVPPSFQAFMNAAADVLEATSHPRAGLFVEALRAPGELSAEYTPGTMRLADGFSEALASQPVASDAEDVRRELAIVWPHFNWYSVIAEHVPEPFRSGHAFVELIGPGGHYVSPNLRFGVFAIAPDTPYPSHVHEAEEIYYVLSGTALWQQDDQPFQTLPPGSVLHNEPFRPHAMTTGEEMLITLWGWRGDIRFEQYRYV